MFINMFGCGLFDIIQPNSDLSCDSLREDYILQLSKEPQQIKAMSLWKLRLLIHKGNDLVMVA